MKKNTDFEIIEQKINASPDAPESAGRDFVLAQLEQAEQNAPANIIPIKKKSNAKRVMPTLAAAIAVVVIAAIGFGVVPNLPKTRVIATTDPGEVSTSVLTAYDNYALLKKDLKALSNKDKNNSLVDYLLRNKTYDMAKKSNEGTESVAVAGSMFGETFTQVAGVDEDDIIKTNGKYIFYAGYHFSDDGGFLSKSKNYYWNSSQSYVFVFSAQGKNAKLINTIDLADSKDEGEVSGMFLSDNTLVVLQSNYQKTTAMLFDISDIQNIQKTAQFSQSGYYSAARLIENKLFVVSNQTNDDSIPYVFCGDQKQDIPAKCIYKTENPSSADFLVISQIDILSGDKIEQAKAVLGGSRNVYCNEEHMFVLADISNYDDSKDYWHERSQLFKIDIANSIRFTASVTLDGSAKNQYAMDEYNGVFRIAVTDTNTKGEDVNRLYTFDTELKKIGTLADFAAGEHIEAVRFFGDTAYVITYETTDPLFVIDLSNAAAPTILGEVKLDGFSTTLIPVGENKLLGIGTDADYSDYASDSLKLALFDISDRANPKLLDECICKNVSSDAMFATKEILRNSANGSFTVYASFYENYIRRYDSEGDYEYYDYDTRFGALTFSVQGEKIVINSRYISPKLTSAVGRCTFVDDTIYMIDDAKNIDCTQY